MTNGLEEIETRWKGFKEWQAVELDPITDCTYVVTDGFDWLPRTHEESEEPEVRREAHAIAHAPTDIAWLLAVIHIERKMAHDLQLQTIAAMHSRDAAQKMLRMELTGVDEPLTEDELNFTLREAGLDPDQVRLDGIEFIKRELDALKARAGIDKSDRDAPKSEHHCPVCNWPYAVSPDEGCVPGNCSMRPTP